MTQPRFKAIYPIESPRLPNMPDRAHGIVAIDRPHPINGDRYPFNTVETLQCNVSTQRDVTRHDLTQNPSSGIRRRMMSEISPKTGSLGCNRVICADGSLNHIRQCINNNPAK